MVESIKTDVEVLLRINKGLIFTGPYEENREEISWCDLIIEKEGDVIRIVPEDDIFRNSVSSFHLSLSELAICEYLQVERVTGLQIIQYIKEQSKTVKYEMANAEPRSENWWYLHSYWDLLQYFADGIFLAEAYHSIRKETKFFESFCKRVLAV